MRTFTLLLTQVVLAAGAGYAGYQAATMRTPPPAAVTAGAPGAAAANASSDAGNDPRRAGSDAGAASRPSSAPPPSAAPAFSFRVAVERASPSVVTVYPTRQLARGRGARSDKFAQGLGSGVVVDAAGLVLTNYHVIEGAQALAVALPDGTVADATLVGVDPDTDLALLRVANANLRPITLGSTRDLAVGDVVLAVGNPLGVGQTVTQGIVSATGRKRLGINPIENFVQTDAAINPGNSGGALVDAEGRLVGINTVILSQGGGFEGIGFAIPVELARQVATSLARDGRVARGWLGVAAEDNEPGHGGVLIRSVQRNGPAARAGLRAGDVVTRLGNRPILGADDMMAATLELEPGTRVAAQVLRGRQQITLQLELGRRPPLRQQAQAPR